ncbi:hypothetical protein D9M73_163500 [compost metagenome]
MHTSSVGGWSVTLHTAEAVKPQRPATPSVVMTETAPPSSAMALRNPVVSTMVLPLRCQMSSTSFFDLAREQQTRIWSLAAFSSSVR